MQLCAMNMNLMAEKNFVVVELGFKKNVKGAIVAHEIFKSYTLNVLNKHEYTSR